MINPIATIIDLGVQDMQFVQVLPNGQSSYALDNAIFDVSNGASLGLIGSSDVIALENGAGNVSISGNGNMITGSSTTGAALSISGTGNVVYVGDNAVVWDGHGYLDQAYGDTITIGANSTCYLAWSSGTTVNATGGGCFIEVAGPGGYHGSDSVINANNDGIYIGGAFEAASAKVNGNGNAITLIGNSTLNLSGSNNAISFSANGTYINNSQSEMIQTDTGYWLREDADGKISFSASSFSINNEVATIGLGNGNVVTISDVKSLSNMGDSQVSQLVSAMACYQNESVGVSSNFITQTPTDTLLFATSHHQA